MRGDCDERGRVSCPRVLTPRALAQPSSRACCTLRQISMPPPAQTSCKHTCPPAPPHTCRSHRRTCTAFGWCTLRRISISPLKSPSAMSLEPFRILAATRVPYLHTSGQGGSAADPHHCCCVDAVAPAPNWCCRHNDGTASTLRGHAGWLTTWPCAPPQTLPLPASP